MNLFMFILNYLIKNEDEVISSIFYNKPSDLFELL